MQRAIVKSNMVHNVVDVLKEDAYFPNQSVFVDYKDTASFRPGKDSEINYSRRVLIGPWFEERRDLKYLCQGERLTSPYDNYHQTTYGLNYNSYPVSKVPKPLWGYSNHRKHRKFVSFPSHQPELDLPMKGFVPWETTYNANYVKHPVVCRKCPDKTPQDPCDEVDSK